jgi:hypothetical protein
MGWIFLFLMVIFYGYILWLYLMVCPVDEEKEK